MNDEKAPLKPLTIREAAFAARVIEDPMRSYAESARLAGYAPKSAAQQAARLLNRENVATMIEQAIGDVIDRAQINSEWILLQAAEMFTADVADILTPEGSFKPIHEWPMIWRQMLSSFDVMEVEESLGHGIRVKVGEVKKAKFIDKLKALELIGKHVAVGAFKETVEHNHRHAHVHLDAEGFREARARVIAADDC